MRLGFDLISIVLSGVGNIAVIVAMAATLFKLQINIHNLL